LGHSGWKGTIAEVTRVAYARAEALNTERPVTPVAARAAVRRWFTGENVAPDTMSFFAALIAELEAAQDPEELYERLRDDYLQPGSPAAEEAEPPAAEPPAEPAPLAKAIDQEVEKALTAERDRLAEQLKDSEAELVSVTEILATVEEALRAANEELRVAGEAAIDAGTAEPVLPELAFECFAEMVGQHISVGEDGDVGGALELLERKKERALELAKRVATLEVQA
jgi:hypothetical protein